MLDVELVKDFKDHALETLKNQIHESLFTAVDNEVPDPFNNFYGLAVLSEVKAFENKDFLDLEKIKNYLLIELNSFTPKAVSKNYFLLVCIRLLEKAGLEIETPEQKLEDKLLNFNLLQSENIRIISDTFYFLSSLKLLDQKEKIKDLSDEYMQQIKDYLSNVNLNKMTLTDQSQLLLIIDLLNQQEQEKELISELLNKLFNVTTFFNSDLENEEFYWQKDITAYLIELTMLYWTLLATIQYQDLIE
jgi:Na+/phosphate symporter